MCTDCEKRPTCAKLCDKAERYAAKDSVKLRELTIGLEPIEFGEWPEGSNGKKVSQKDVTLARLLLRGLPKYAICDILGITEETYRQRLSRMRKKL